MSTLKTNVTGTNLMLTNESDQPPTQWTLRYRSWNPVVRYCDMGHAHALVLHSLNTGIATAHRVYNGGIGQFDGSPCVEHTFDKPVPIMLALDTGDGISRRV